MPAIGNRLPASATDGAYSIGFQSRIQHSRLITSSTASTIRNSFCWPVAHHQPFDCNCNCCYCSSIACTKHVVRLSSFGKKWNTFFNCLSSYFRCKIDPCLCQTFVLRCLGKESIQLCRGVMCIGSNFVYAVTPSHPVCSCLTGILIAWWIYRGGVGRGHGFRNLWQKQWFCHEFRGLSIFFDMKRLGGLRHTLRAITYSLPSLTVSLTIARSGSWDSEFCSRDVKPTDISR